MSLYILMGGMAGWGGGMQDQADHLAHFFLDGLVSVLELSTQGHLLVWIGIMQGPDLPARFPWVPFIVLYLRCWCLEVYF